MNNNHYWWRTEINQIEKMYENAGIEKKRYCEFDDDCPYMFGHLCKDCDINYKPEGYKYPPFTAEKQIELIKWLAELADFATFSPDVSIDEDTKVKIYGFAFVMRGEKHYYVDDKFEIALAKCFNNLWQDLTEEECTQIKEILE